MPGTNYTTNLRLANPSLNDTGWGTTVSSGMIDLTDQAIAGLATADVTTTDVTLTILDGSAGTNSARNMFLNIIGTPGAARSVIVPTNRKLYFVTNNCGQTVTVGTSAGTGVAVPHLASMTLRINAAGTQIEQAFTYAASMSLGTALPATSGGTGQSSYAVGDILYAGTTTTLAKLAVGATNAVLTVAAGIPAWVTTLPVASGGTGAATLAANNVLLGNGTSAVQVVAPGTSGNVLTASGGTWVSATPAVAYAGPNLQIFDANGTFTVPAGITSIYVAVMAGGGGGSGSSQSGAGRNTGGKGGLAFARVSGLTPLSGISVTVGSGGAGGNGATGSFTAGSPGNTSSFGSYVSCTGGSGGQNSGANITAASGIATFGAGAQQLGVGSTGLVGYGNDGQSRAVTEPCSLTIYYSGGGGGGGSGGGGGGGSSLFSGGANSGGSATGVGVSGSASTAATPGPGGAGGRGVSGGAVNGGAGGTASGNGGGGGGGGGGAVVVFW